MNPLNPLDAADDLEAQIIALFDVAMMVWSGRQKDPTSFPAYGPDQGFGVIARRIVAYMLDTGWTPPTEPNSWRALASRLAEEGR
jgi:hypothetical protein